MVVATRCSGAVNEDNEVTEVTEVTEVVDVVDVVAVFPVVEAFLVNDPAGKDFVTVTAVVFAALLLVRLLLLLRSLSPPSGISFNAAKTCINAFNL